MQATAEQHAPITSIKVRFHGEQDWSWVAFKKGTEGEIVSSDQRLTASWMPDGKGVEFHVNEALEVAPQGILILASRDMDI